MKKISIPGRLSAVFAKAKTAVAKPRQTLSVSFNRRYGLAGAYGAVTGGGIALSGVGLAAVVAISVPPLAAIGLTAATAGAGAIFCAKILQDIDRLSALR